MVYCRKESNQKCVPLKVVNIGLQRFYDSIAAQGVPVIQVDWYPPVKKTEEVQEFLDMFM